MADFEKIPGLLAMDNMLYFAQVHKEQYIKVSFLAILCPHIKRWGGYCFTIVHLSVGLSLSVCVSHKLNLLNKHFPVTSKLFKLRSLYFA